MAININPNRITTHTGTGKAADRRRTSPDGEKLVVPAKADLGIIPAPETLATLIRSAVASFRKGVFWDRGTILNLLV